MKCEKSPAVVILSTASPEQAPALAQALVEERLVACVNIVPVLSRYRWKGEIVNDAESLMIMKTTLDHSDDVMEAIRRMHSYEIPEILVLPVIAGYAPYLGWVAQETGDSDISCREQNCGRE